MLVRASFNLRRKIQSPFGWLLESLQQTWNCNGRIYKNNARNAIRCFPGSCPVHSAQRNFRSIVDATSRPIYRATGEQSLRVQICCIGVCTRDGARKTTKSQYRSKPSARGQQRLSLRSRDAKCQGSRNKLKMISSPVSGGQQRAADPDNPWIRVQRLLDPRDSIQARLDAVPR